MNRPRLHKGDLVQINTKYYNLNNNRLGLIIGTQSVLNHCHRHECQVVWFHNGIRLSAYKHNYWYPEEELLLVLKYDEL
jgi:hypothetical protein